MNIAALAQQTYEDTGSLIKTDKSIEYQIFSKITYRLSRTIKGEFEDFKELVGALHDNRRLWTLLAADVASGDNELPSELRAQIFYLAEFTEKHSKEVLAGNADVQVLVEINTAVMRGLRSIPVTEQ